MARQQGATTALGGKFETVYGTAPAGAYLRFPFARQGLGAEQPLLDNELLGYGRDPLAPVKDAETVSGTLQVPLDVIGMGYWLKLMFGAPVTTGTGPYVHTFASGNYTLPSMALEVQHPEVPNFDLYTGVKGNTLSWTMERQGLLTANIEVMGQREVSNNATTISTLTDIPLQRFTNFQGNVERDGVALGNIVSNSISYTNNLDPIEILRADGLVDGFDASMAMLSGTCRVRFADKVLLNQAIAGTPCALAFKYSISAAASLVFTAHEVYLPRPRKEIEGPTGIMVDFDWKAAKAALTPFRMFTAVLTNSQASYA
jgi:hypothetical protein